MALGMAVAFPFVVQAGKSSGGTTSTGVFTFTYDIGTTVTNYHAYGYACQVGAVSPKPSGTVVLGNWWVWDLGRATGTKAISCPKPIVPKGTTSSIVGALLFADAHDLGGHAFIKPVVQVEIYNSKWYNGYASVQVITPLEPAGIQLYWGPPFTPFTWDFSDYVWDVQPATP